MPIKGLPPKANINRIIHKKNFLQKNSSKRFRSDLTDIIQKITRSYKLSSETVNIPSWKNVQEIQIFRVDLKLKDRPSSLLELLAKQIPYPILWYISYRDEFYYAIVYEHRLYESDRNTEIDFQLNATNLDYLYNSLVHIFLDTAESDFDQALTIHSQKSNLQKEISWLERKIRSTKQPNKILELNRQLNHKRQELSKLS